MDTSELLGVGKGRSELSIRQKVKRMAQLAGFDIVRYPLASPTARTVKLMKHYDIDCVVDVGANNGGFAATIRQLGYTGKIFSFEPLQGPFQSLLRGSLRDKFWEVHQLALGAGEAEVTINVSGNDGLSSSVLPMLDRHVTAAPSTRYVGQETVRQVRLDSLRSNVLADCSTRTFLKIDVQGYEHAVLEGASGLFQEGIITAMQLEVSLVDLYEGGMTYREGFDFADSHGMRLVGLDPVLADPISGELLQVDAVFIA